MEITFKIEEGDINNMGGFLLCNKAEYVQASSMTCGYYDAQKWFKQTDAPASVWMVIDGTGRQLDEPILVHAKDGDGTPLKAKTHAASAPPKVATRYRLEYNPTTTGYNWHLDNFTHEPNSFGWFTICRSVSDIVGSKFITLMEEKYQGKRRVSLGKIKEEFAIFLSAYLKEDSSER